MTRQSEATAAGRAVIAALQGALTAENAAIFGYGVAGAYLTGRRQSAATAYWNDHKAAGDSLAAMLRSRGAQPAAAEAAYKLPFTVHTTGGAIALAQHLEDGVTAAYLEVVAVSDVAARRFGALAMQACAVRATFWRGVSEAFPGFAAGSPAPRRTGQSG